MKQPLDARGITGPQGKITTREYDPAAQFEQPATRLPFRAVLITCCECHELFTWSAKEQEFFAAQGFQTPKRCRSCQGRRREKYARKF